MRKRGRNTLKLNNGLIVFCSSDSLLPCRQGREKHGLSDNRLCFTRSDFTFTRIPLLVHNASMNTISQRAVSCRFYTPSDLSGSAQFSEVRHTLLSFIQQWLVALVRSDPPAPSLSSLKEINGNIQLSMNKNHKLAYPLTFLLQNCYNNNCLSYIITILQGAPLDGAICFLL